MLTEYGYHDAACPGHDAGDLSLAGLHGRERRTTIWERWNSDKEGPGMNSRNTSPSAVWRSG